MKAIYLIIISLLLSGCIHNINSPLKLTVYQTYQTAEMLPVFAAIDLRSDSLSTAKYIHEYNQLAEAPSDTFKTDVWSYLYSGAHNSLFKKLTPNLSRHPNEVQNSAFLGYSLDKDTLAINKIINDSGALNYGTVINWIPRGCDLEGKKHYALVMLNPAFKVIDLNASDLDKAEVKPSEYTVWWRMISKVFDRKTYTLTAYINQSGIGKIKSAFGPNTSLLIRCDLKRHNFYSASDSNLVKYGVHFDELSANDLK